MRVIRILVYEGDEEFMRASFEHRSVVRQKVTPRGTITETFLCTGAPAMADWRHYVEDSDESIQPE